MTRLHVNNFVTTLDGDISSGTTSIVITNATGFPAVGAGVTANVTIANGSTIEIVTCTAISGTTLTVTRGAESTTPSAFVSGSIVSIRPTADSVDRKADGAASSTDNAIARFDDTTGKVIQDSGVLIDDSDNITNVTSLEFSSTAGIIGTTTDDDADSGSVGEFLFTQVLQANAVSLTNNTNVDIATLPLGAGDWIISGTVTFTGQANSTIVTRQLSWINTSSVTQPDASLISGMARATSTASAFSFRGGTVIPTQRFSLSGSTTLYLSCEANFSGGTLTGCGIITALRVR